MGPSGFPVVIESQAIMVSIRVAIGKLIHALEVWSDDPRLPNIEPLQHEPSTADSTAIQRCIGQHIYIALCPRVVVLYCNTAATQRLHSTALQRSTLYSALQSPSGCEKVSSCNARATGHYRAHRRSEHRRYVFARLERSATGAYQQRFFLWFKYSA